MAEQSMRAKYSGLSRFSRRRYPPDNSNASSVAPEDHRLHEHREAVDRDEAAQRLVGAVAVDEAPLHTGEDSGRRDTGDREQHRHLRHTRVVPHDRTQDHDRDRGPEERYLGRDREPVDGRVRDRYNRRGPDHLPSPLCGAATVGTFGAL